MGLRTNSGIGSSEGIIKFNEGSTQTTGWSELGKGSPGAERSRQPARPRRLRNLNSGDPQRVRKLFVRIKKKKKTSHLQGIYRTTQLQAQNEQSRVRKRPKASFDGSRVWSKPSGKCCLAWSMLNVLNLSTFMMKSVETITVLGTSCSSMAGNGSSNSLG